MDDLLKFENYYEGGKFDEGSFFVKNNIKNVKPNQINEGKDENGSQSEKIDKSKEGDKDGEEEKVKEDKEIDKEDKDQKDKDKEGKDKEDKNKEDKNKEDKDKEDKDKEDKSKEDKNKEDKDKGKVKGKEDKDEEKGQNQNNNFDIVKFVEGLVEFAELLHKYDNDINIHIPDDIQEKAKNPDQNSQEIKDFMNEVSSVFDNLPPIKK